MKPYKYVLLCGILLAGCKENANGPADTEAPPPPPVTNVAAEVAAGAVKLTYSLPDDKNLLYVKAVVEINGKQREAKSSGYQNFLELKGFGDTLEHVVKVYAVSRSEKPSQPVEIKVKTLLPPVLTTFASLKMIDDFGGATVSFENPSEAEINVIMLTTDADGDWVNADILYTKKPKGFFSVRGYDPQPRKFAVYVKDRWDNRSDTLIKTLTPVFEKQLDRLKFKEIFLPGDQKAAWGWVMPNIWDGVIVNNSNVDKPGFHTAAGVGWPQWFTFNLGVKAKLSRYRFWQRGSWVAFTDRNIRKFEIWGSNNPNPDGSWESWTKLVDGESTKPSGLPMGQQSAEDLALVGAGEETVFPPGTPPMQYIRIKVTETWSGADSFYIMQVAFWGSEI